jgi:hypothetical protein
VFKIHLTCVKPQEEGESPEQTLVTKSGTRLTCLYGLYALLKHAGMARLLHMLYALLITRHGPSSKKCAKLCTIAEVLQQATVSATLLLM